MAKKVFCLLLIITICASIFALCTNLDAANNSNSNNNITSSLTSNDEPIDISSFQGIPDINITVDIEKKETSSRFDCVVTIKNNTQKSITKLSVYLVKCYDGKSPLESKLSSHKLSLKNIDVAETHSERWSIGTEYAEPSAYHVYLAYVEYEDGLTWGLSNIDHKTVVTRNAEVDVCVYNSSTITSEQTYQVSYSASIIHNSHVGNNWSYGMKYNDTFVASASTIKVEVAENRGPRLTIYGIEKDSDEDYGEGIIRFPKMEIGETVSLVQQIVITENGGRYTGHQAYMQFTVTLTRISDNANDNENNHSNQNNTTTQNNIDDLRYIVNGVCNNYNGGETAYGGKLYATINSATSITITHDIPNSLSFDEQSNVEKMENIIAQLFSETLNEVFPEYITVVVKTSVVYSSSAWMQ